MNWLFSIENSEGKRQDDFVEWHEERVVIWVWPKIVIIGCFYSFALNDVKKIAAISVKPSSCPIPKNNDSIYISWLNNHFTLSHLEHF